MSNDTGAEQEFDSLTVGQLVEFYHEINGELAKVRATEKRYKTLITALKMHMLKRMQEDDAESYKTSSGTAYKSAIRKITVADKPMFEQWVVDHSHPEMLKDSVVQSAVLEYIDATDTVPPGLEIFQIINVNINQSK